MSTTHRSTTILIILAGTIAALSAACGGAPPSRSGQASDPIELSSETRGAGSVGGDVLAQLVNDTSTAAVRISAPPERAYSDADNEGDILEAVQAGEFDVTVIRAGRLADAGAASLAPLQTPFLVTNEEHASRLAADPVAEELMAGLSDIGLIGLALAPGGLRHIIGYETAIVGPSELDGAMVNTRPGDATEAIVTALGGTFDHSIADVRDAKAQTGELRGIELSYSQMSAVVSQAVVTSNLTLYTKFDVVVIRADAWNGLSDTQQDELRSAARRAAVTTVAARGTEAELLDRWCAQPWGSSVVATDAQLQQWHTALQPLIDEETASPPGSVLIGKVAALGDGLAPPVGKVCGAPTDPMTSEPSTSGPTSETSTPTTSSFTVEASGPQDVLEGVWRMEVDKQDLLDVGLTLQEANANSGVWTLTIVGNVATVDQPHGPDCTWEFTFAGTAVSLDQAAQGNDGCVGQDIGTYELDGDTVNFHWDAQRDYDVALDNAVFANGMEKIG